MTIVVVNMIEGGGQELYDRVNPQVMPNGKLPEGCQAHIAGPVENGWRVISVWDSDAQFQQFRDEQLIPALREAGSEQRIAPNISTDPVHNFLTD